MTKTLESENEIPVHLRMSEDEKKKLESDIEKTKNKIISLKNTLQSPDLDWQNFFNNDLELTGNWDTDKLDFYKEKLSALKRQYDSILSNNTLANQDYLLEKVGNQIDSTTKKIENLDSKTKKLKNTNNKTFGDGISQLKKFGLHLLSLGSIYATVSKASSAYLSQDTELAQKLQSVWVGLGSFLAPAIEYISDVLLKGLGYLNEFVKALTGIDFIAGANAKALDKQAKAQKNLNNQTYAFDEMNIQQSQSTSSISGSSSSGLIEIPELNQDLVKKLQDLAHWLQENWDWISKVGIALGVTFGAVKIAGLLGNIGKLIGVSGAAGTGLSALAWLLGIIAAVWLGYVAIKGIDEAIKQAKNLNEEIEKNYEMHKEQRKSVTDTAAALTDMAIEQKKAGKEIDYTTDYLRRQIKYSKNQYETTKNQIIPILGELTGANDNVRKSQHEIAIEIAGVNSNFKKLYDQGILNDKQAQEYYDSLCDQIVIMGELGYDISDLREQYINLTNGNYNITINAELHDKVTNNLKSLIKNLTGSTIYLNVESGKTHGGGGRAFAQGGIVTQPTKAIIGEAGYNEYVLPERSDYLSRLASLINQYGGGGQNVNYIYLDGRLIQRQVNNVTKSKNFLANS